MSATEVLARFANARKSGACSVAERARRYIDKCPPAISGQRGHDTTFRVAAVLWNGFGLSETDTLALLSEYNQRCVPPWSEGALIHKVKSVANGRHAERRGYLVGESRKQKGPSRTGQSRNGGQPRCCDRRSRCFARWC